MKPKTLQRRSSQQWPEIEQAVAKTPYSLFTMASATLYGIRLFNVDSPEVMCLTGQEASFRAALRSMPELPQEAMVWAFFCGRGAGSAGAPRIVPTDAPSDCYSLEQELISQLVSRHTRPTTFERKRQAPYLMVSIRQGCSAQAETPAEHLLHFPR